MNQLGLLLLITTELALVLPATGGAQTPAPSVAAGVNPVLMPGDMVRLKIWREPDLSGDFRVDENGEAVFPKLGAVPVGHLSTDSVKSVLLTSYARYLRDPSIEVTFLRRINVLGEVKNPGIYQVDPTMTLADVLAMAGGVTSNGNRKKIELLRDGHRVPIPDLSLQSTMADSPLRSGDQLRVPERSWLARNAGVIAAAITGTAVITTALIRNP